MNFISKRILYFVFSSFCGFIVCDEKERPLTFFESSFIGAATASSEVVLPGQILSYGMNQAIKGKPFVFKNSYRGFAANAIGEMPVGAIQRMVQATLSTSLIQSSDEKPSFCKKAIISYMAGIAGALVDTPSNMMQIYKQDDKHAHKSMRQIARELKLKSFRGFVPNAFIKEGVFCFGYQALAPQAEEIVENYTNNQVIKKTVGGIGAGIITAAITQPGAVLRTKMQDGAINLRAKSASSTTLQVASDIFKKEGLSGFFKGFLQRGTRIAIAVPLYAAYSSFFEKQLRKND